MRGQTLVEMVESTYVAFRTALELMILNTTCTCAACRNLKDLDLKFFVHCGSFTIQKLNEYHELLGNDVNLVHRLAKNHIKEQTGFRAYAAYTQAVIEKMGLEEIAANMSSHRETFADVGEVQLYVQDMQNVWEGRGKESRIRVEQNNLLAKLESNLPYPTTMVWQYITDPRFRTVLNGSDSQELKDLSAGRAGIGSTYVCAHGKSRPLQPILDWEPFDQYTTCDLVFGAKLLTTLQLAPAGNGTCLRYKLGLLKASPVMFLIFKYLMVPIFLPMMPARIAKLRQRIDQNISERKSSDTADSRISEQAIPEKQPVQHA